MVTPVLLLQNIGQELTTINTNVQACIVESERLCEDGAALLTPQEYDMLRRNRDQLKHTYTTTANVRDRLEIRLVCVYQM